MGRCEGIRRFGSIFGGSPFNRGHYLAGPGSAVTSFETLGVDVAVAEGVALVTVSGELDPFSAPQLKAAVTGMMRPEVQEVALDLSRVTFIDVRGFDTVTEAAEEVRRSGRRFAVRSRSLPVIRIEQLITALDRRPAERVVGGATQAAFRAS